MDGALNPPDANFPAKLNATLLARLSYSCLVYPPSQPPKFTWLTGAGSSNYGTPPITSDSEIYLSRFLKYSGFCFKCAYPGTNA
ncbi:hypothetical protein T265_00073 [Opisthorchis viverrini]|uniref:Uncharacterized protein n=1 Tax=Opisthorchis viverrini TaxID=6198 RepID=A0A075A3H7_OPIVI|nr:hypothetical protein T265_00073 [Opisthorchis viverrini]KER34213.1 hypothetical protein T265_00073 [Opisthorchis viverrini]